MNERVKYMNNLKYKTYTHIQKYLNKIDQDVNDDDGDDNKDSPHLLTAF